MFMLAQQGSGSSAAPTDDFWYEPAYRGLSGLAPMQLSVVFACVRVLAETVAQLPLILYRRLPNGGKERAVEHPLFRLMGMQPNTIQTSFEWREMMQGHLELRGNAFSRKQFSGLELTALWPMHPDRIKIEYLPGVNRMRYRYRPDGGEEIILSQDDVLHLRGFQSDGFSGLNPIEVMALTLKNYAVAEAYGTKFFQNDAVQGGWIEHPANFKDKETREGFRGAYREQVQKGGIPVLEYGLKYHEVGMKMVDAQFLEQRKYNAIEIANRIFRVPPHKIGILDRATWTNIESQNIEFVTESLLARLRRNEQRYNESLLSDEEQQVYFFEFLVDGLLRGDSAARAAYFDKALTKRWMVPNEVRSIENLNPVSWGDEPLAEPNQAVPGAAAPQISARASLIENSSARAVVGKEVNALRALLKRHTGPTLFAETKTFYDDELKKLLIKALAVGPEAAQRYADDSMKLLAAAHANGGWSNLLDEWQASRSVQLLEIINAP